MVKLIPPVKSPKYDDLYYEGIEAMRDDSECYNEAELLKPEPNEKVWVVFSADGTNFVTEIKQIAHDHANLMAADFPGNGPWRVKEYVVNADEITNLEDTIALYQEDRDRVRTILYRAGGPLNGNKLGFQQKQKKLFYDIARILDIDINSQIKNKVKAFDGF